MADIPTFNQIQEAMSLARQGYRLPAEVAEAVIIPALRHYCDFHHPSDPDVLADVFWDEDGEHGMSNAAEVVAACADFEAPGVQFVCEVRRAVTLLSMWAVVTVGAHGRHSANFYGSDTTATERLEAMNAQAAEIGCEA